MKREYKERTFSQKIMIPILLVGAITSVSVMAKPFGNDRGHHMEERLERLIEHLDLNEDQEKKAELILMDLKEQKKSKRSTEKGMHRFMSLNPDDADYLEKVSDHAAETAEHVKSKIMSMAKAKQSLYAILDDTQKAKIAKKTERRLKKFEKRMQERDSN